MKLRYPKLRELREAVTVIFSRRFTTRFPAQPCVVPDSYRGKPKFDDDDCIGCGACVNVCPTECLKMQDDSETQVPTRTITQRHDTCIYCGNCQDCCTTQKGIKLSNEWDLATLDRASTVEEHKYELQLCEKCGAVVGTKKQLVWVGEKLGPLAYANPSVVLAKKEALFATTPAMPSVRTHPNESEISDFARILCPQCKRKLNIRL